MKTLERKRKSTRATSTPPRVVQPIRVLLVHNHVVMRAGIRMLIESWPGVKVVAEADSPKDFGRLPASEPPDIVLLDIDGEEALSAFDLFSGTNGVTLAARIVVLTGSCDSEMHERLVRLGAVGIVHKNRATDELRRALEKVHAGEAWIDRTLTANVIVGISRAGGLHKLDSESERIASLTQRQSEIASLVCNGLKNSEIAERLYISETTVRHHLTSIFNKLEVSSRFELISLLYRNRLGKATA
jgi:two-component system, NarL family, nitrate/nitrite response regulator NarL